MNKALKLSTALGTATIALAFAVTAASADTGVVNTGDNATINSGSTQNTSVTVTNSNTASISQGSFSVANSGLNFTEGNIGGGGISSGNAATSTNLEAQANQNQTGIVLAGATGGSGDVDLVNTGDNLNVNAGDTTNTTVNSTSINALQSQQQSLSLANSGLNGAFDNVDGGDVVSGSAVSTTDMGIEANVNESLFDLSGLGNDVDNTLSYVNTGDDTTVNFGDTTNTSVFITSVNSAMIMQNSFSLANSGLNFTEGNVDGGDVDSGNAATVTDFEVMANQNKTGLNLSGLGMGGNDVEVTNTGNNLVLNSGTTVNTSVTAASNNNSATVQTSVEASNSGLNFGIDNVDGGNASSGNAGTWTGFMSGVNWNQTLLDW